MVKEVSEKWIRDTAKIFYQIFAVDYEDAEFIKKLLTGGGGNSTLCSTWTHLSDDFIKRRISKSAFERLINMIDVNERKMIKKENNIITIPQCIFDNYHGAFYNNAKGADNRKKNGKYFHFDHNPSNKQVLITLYNYKNDYNKLVKEIHTIQTVDLITVEQDDIRTNADRLAKSEKLTGKQRDELIQDEIYDLIVS